MENVILNKGQREVKNKIYYLLFFMFCILQTFAAIETVNSRAKGSSIYSGQIVSIKDNKWPAIQSIGQYTSVKGTGKIVFGVDEYTSQVVSAYTVKVGLNITWYDANGASHIIPHPVDLTISYNPAGEYMDKSIYLINGAYRVVATVAYYKDGNNVTIANANLPANIYIESIQETERYYNFNSNYIANTSSYTVGQQYLFTSNELQISWQTIPGAEEYDLEWTYVNDYDGQSLTTYISASNLLFSFKDNATRIRTTDLSYKISLIYEHGYILYRIRGIGRQLDANTLKYEAVSGNWSADPTTNANISVSTFISNTSASINCNFPTTGNGHEFNKNWQYSSTFAEEGKKKEVVSYFDGSLRNRQSVTKVNTQDQAIVGETFYDYQGRPAVQALPVPAYIAATADPEEKIHYFENFNNSDAKVAANAVDPQYNRTDFDIDAGATCPPSAGPMAVITGASQYYSSNNNDKDGQQAYTPDAKKYPFTQTIYTPDNTGRVRRQSGVGPDHAINSGHETTYLYDRPLQEELDKLFGSEAGYGIRYKKNTVVDANGQLSISYMDEEGKVVATALAGNTPANVGSIGGSVITSNTVYFSHLDADYKDANKEVDNSMVFTYPIVPSISGLYTFNYNLQIPQFRDTCIANFCYDCIYDLEITIKDECGEIIYSINPARKTVGTIDYTCSNSEITFSNTDFSPVFEANLQAAKTYYLEKKLTINEDAINQYLAHYTDTLNNTCIKTLTSFETESLAHIDLIGCNMSCEVCATNLNAFYATHQDPTYADPNDSLYDPTYIYISPDDYQTMLDECTEACKPISVCRTTYNQLLIDMSPNGQYGQYEVNASTGAYGASQPLSVFNCNNAFTNSGASNCGYNSTKYWRNPQYYNDKKHAFVTNDPSNINAIKFYYEADGKTKSKIFLTEISPGVYSPQVDIASNSGLPDGYDDKGVPFIYPHRLNNLSDFISSFKPSWARSLVSYHPEWGYFEWCDDNEDPAYFTLPSTNGLTSQQWDDYLRSKDTWATASTDGIIGLDGTTGSQSNVYDLLAMDPFFQSGKSSITVINRMKAMLDNFVTDPTNSSIVKNVKEATSLIYRCGTKYYDVTCTPNFGAGSDVNILDNEWRTYRTFYLTKKAELQMQLNHEAALGTPSGYAGYYNGCIGTGSNSFNPYSAPAPGFIIFGGSLSPFTGGFYNTATQPCSIIGYQLYASKQKRFVDPQDLANQMAGGATNPSEVAKNLQNNVEYQNYLQTGQCPAILKFKFLLDKLNADGKLGSASGTDADLFYYPAFTVDLYDQVNSGAHTYVNYHWKGTQSGLTLNGGFYNGNTLVCPITLTLTQNFGWNQISSFGKINFVGQVSTGIYSFVLTAMVDSDNDPSTPSIAVAINGTSCINSTCNFPTTTCKSNQTGNDLLNLFNAMATNGHFSSGLSGYNLVASSNPEAPFVTNSIRAALSVTNTLNSTSTYSSGTNSELVGFVNGSTTCNMNMTYVIVSGISTYPAMNTITYFTNIQPDENNAAVFYLTAHYANTNTTFKIKVTMGLNGGTTACFNVGDCAPVTPPTCNTAGNNTLIQLGKFLEEFRSKGSNPDDLSTYNSYTTLLQSFVAGQNPTQIDTVTISNGSQTIVKASENISTVEGESEKKLTIQIAECSITLEFPNFSNGYDFSNVSQFTGITAIETENGAFTITAIMTDSTKQLLHGTSCFKIENCSDCQNPLSTVIFSEQFEEYTAANAASSSGLNFTNDFNYVGYNQCPYGGQGGNIGSDMFNFSIHENSNTQTTPCDNIPDHNQLPTKQNKLFLNFTSLALSNNTYVLWKTLPSNPVTVVPNKEYEFSAWVRADNIFESSGIRIKLEVTDNNNNTSTIQSQDLLFYVGNSPESNWVQVKGKWSSGNATSVTLAVKGRTISSIYSVDFYLDDISLTLKQCDGGITEIPPTEIPPNPCEQHLTDIAITNATHAYEKYMDDISKDFRERFITKCKSAMEDLTGTNPDKQHHYTLYYYDQAGNLIKTVPPEGVQLVDLSVSANKAAITNDRINKTHNFFTDHTLETKYEYNSLNQLVRQSTPDNDKMDRWDISGNSNNTIAQSISLKDIQFNGNTGFAVGNDIDNSGVIYISTDNGQTWAPATSIGLDNITDIAFTDAANNGCAITDKGYLLNTTNNGVSWTINPNVPLQAPLRDITFLTDVSNPTNAATIGFIVGDGATILRTQNGGNNWQQITIAGLSNTINLTDVQFAADNLTGTITGTGGTVLFTTDGGQNWNLPASPLNTTIVINDAYVYPASSGVVDVLLVGNDPSGGKIIKGSNLNSVSTSNSWSVKASTTSKLNSITMSAGANYVFNNNDDVGYVGGEKGKFFITSDGGTTWSNQPVTWLSTTNSNAYPDITELRIPTEATFPTTNANAFATLTNGNILQYDNSLNPKWMEVENTTSGKSKLNSLCTFPGSSVAYLAGNGGAITLYGQTAPTSGNFTPLTNTIYPTLNKIAVAQNNSGYIYALGNSGFIVNSTNNGASWSPVINGNSSNLYAACFPTQNGVVAGQNSFVATINSGVVTVVSAVPSVGDIYDIAKQPNGNYFAVAAGGNVLTTSSSTGGSGWTSVSSTNFGTSNLYDIYFEDANHGYIVGANGKFVKTVDGGTTWTSPATGVTADLREVYFADDLIGYAFGDNNTVIKTIDGGLNWRIETATSGSNYTGVAFKSNGQAYITSSSAPNLVKLNDQSNDHSSRFLYDRLGRLIISQNTKQFNKSPKAYSYTIYDALGRIKEVGEIATTTDPETLTNYNGIINETDYNTWLTTSGNVKSEVTLTVYDLPVSGTPAGFTQSNLRKRVSATYITKDGNLANYTYATYYNYDVHGNVKELVQDNPSLAILNQQYKTIAYDYDLVSGKVNEVMYQQEQADAFYHKYEYDGDNRITNVYTSKDNVIWDEDAKYFYYKHGPLARTEEGDLKVQAMDYAYTLQGWIKGVNSNTLDATRDIGKDGITGNLYASVQTDIHSKIGRDAYGYSLSYYDAINGTGGNGADYVKINTNSNYNGTNDFIANALSSPGYMATSPTNNYNLYNGNIKRMVTTITDPTSTTPYQGLPQLTAYKYDQLNRISEMKAYRDINLSTNTFGAESGYDAAYESHMSYDANGNILTMSANGKSGNIAMDNMNYQYDINSVTGKKRSNKLYHVNDVASTYNTDIDDQGTFTPAQANNLSIINTNNNYGYDEIGNLAKDNQEEIANIEWTVYGKISKIVRTNTSTKPDMEFKYDASGNRVMKRVLLRDGSGEQNYTYYVRDASGNVMATYERKIIVAGACTGPLISDTYKQKEHDIYGSSRLGLKTHVNDEDEILATRNYCSSGLDANNEYVVAGSLTTTSYTVNPTYTNQTRGGKQYEMSNHLGNVLTTVSDRKIAVDGNSDNIIDNYLADVLSTTDYYAFGSPMPGRTFNTGNYRYGFNGKEKDSEIEGDGNSYDYGMRIYNPRLGRFLSTDPLQKKFAELTPYQFASNSPISNTDLDGLESNLAIFSKGLDAVAFEIRAKDVADKVKSAHFTVHPVASGDELLTLFKTETAKEGSIGNIVTNSHAFASGLSISMGDRKGFYTFTNSFLAKEAATMKDLKAAIDKKEIVFDPNAVAIFAGCSCGNKDPKGDAGFAEQFTTETGVSSIGSKGSFAPVIKDKKETGEYTSDEGFYRFDKQKDGTIKETFIGKTINMADYLNKNNKVEDKSKKTTATKKN